MTHPTPALTELEFARLLSGQVARVHYRRASLEITGKGDEARFAMEGPSGRHSLLAAATDRARLNAHWEIFAAHELNAYATA